MSFEKVENFILSIPPGGLFDTRRGNTDSQTAHKTTSYKPDNIGFLELFH